MLTITQIGYVFLVLVIHYIADFILQDERWAQKKSHDFNALCTHTYVYSLFWFMCGCVYIVYLMLFGNLIEAGLANIYMWKLVLFTLITYLAHTITDYSTSPIVKKYFLNHVYGSKIPNWGAFSMIGIDQILHYFQLFLTLYLLGV